MVASKPEKQDCQGILTQYFGIVGNVGNLGYEAKNEGCKDAKVAKFFGQE